MVKNALVTGAQRGIGRAIALRLAAAGLDVAVLDREKTAELEAVAASIRALGRRGVAIAGDLADIGRHGAALDEAEALLGSSLDCLVNNAGVSVLTRGDLLDVTPESFDRCIGTNTRGTFFLMQEFARRKSSKRRVMVTVTSSNAVAASLNRGEYCISKAGLSMASTLFALRLAEEGVEVYEVQPGIIETEMTARVKPVYDQFIESGGTAMRRWGQPDDVAAVVRTLVCEGLPYTVGQPIRVDGGLLVTKY